MSESTVLTPGTDIKPIISVAECKTLLLRLYGLKCDNIKELNGYDDRNFKITVENAGNSNKFIQESSGSGYILKIMNSLDSKKDNFVSAQNSLLLFLADNDIKCPKPIQNVNGEYYSLEKLSSGEHIVRLMIFMPGQILLGVSYNYNLFYEVGKNIAAIDNILKNFNHVAYTTHKTLWMLDSVPELHNFLYVIKDQELKSIITTIITRFESDILSNICKFERGMIHGDCNEQNVLVEKHTDGFYHYSAILDFGDTSYGCYLFELAITMLYMMLLENDMNAGCHVLAGYDSVRKVTELELDSLLLCMSARLCQSLVLGAYTSQLDPGNSNYILTTAKKGWDLLKILHLDDGTLLQLWKDKLGQ